MAPAPSTSRRGGLEVPLGPDAARSLRGLSQVLGRIFSVRLDDLVPSEKQPLKNVKEFCVGLLEKPTNHAWGERISRLTPREKLSVAGSLFLARKVLPSVPDLNQADKHAALMNTPAPAPPPGYLDHCEKVIDGIFPVGWDRGYKGHVLGYTPTSSSSLETPRSGGGAQDWLQGMGLDWFQDQCLAAGPGSIPFEVKYSIVSTSGKQRGVTIASARSHLLGPLHRTMYDCLSGQKWLLRGEARGKKFKGFQRVEGEVFVSGDYESATDGLNLGTTEFCLRRILSRCRFVPRGIQEYAMSSLRAEINYGDRVVSQKRGQLMGNFLSFPLLCLQNYLSFSFLLPRPGIPVRINGDDIVFRSTRQEFERWAEGVSALGLVLSRGKTMTHKRNFSLNSSFFEASGTRVREVSVIRLKPVEGKVPNGADFLRFCRGWRSLARTFVGALWLRNRRRNIEGTGRSVGALGIPADNSQLCNAGLAEREAFFRGSKPHLAIRECPVPRLDRRARSDVLAAWCKVPVGTVKERAPVRAAWQRAFREACFSYAWSDRGAVIDAEQAWWEEVKRGGLQTAYRQWLRMRATKRSLLRGFTTALRPPTEVVQVRTEWVPRDFLSVPAEPCIPKRQRECILYAPVDMDGFIIYKGWHGLGT